MSILVMALLLSIQKVLHVGLTRFLFLPRGLSPFRVSLLLCLGSVVLGLVRTAVRYQAFRVKAWVYGSRLGMWGFIRS